MAIITHLSSMTFSRWGPSTGQYAGFFAAVRGYRQAPVYTSSARLHWPCSISLPILSTRLRPPPKQAALPVCFRRQASGKRDGRLQTKRNKGKRGFPESYGIR